MGNKKKNGQNIEISNYEKLGSLGKLEFLFEFVRRVYRIPFEDMEALHSHARKFRLLLEKSPRAIQFMKSEDFDMTLGEYLEKSFHIRIMFCRDEFSAWAHSSAHSTGLVKVK